MHDDLALVGRGGIQSYPASNNATSAGGAAFTAIVVQCEGDGIADPHYR